jgi:hydrogenase maturation protein HypF
MIADPGETGSYSIQWTNSSPLVVPTGQIVRQVADDIRNNVSPSVISARFHNTIVTIVRELADAVSRDTGIREICLSGGVFQNALLLEKTIDILSDNQYLVYTHTEVPANDGGISLGQAVIAGARK